MRIYLQKMLLFALFCFLMDRGFGYVADYLYINAKNSETAKTYYICEKSKDDVLIFGTSRGVHHYDPKIIEDSVGLSCYNCGYDGCGSILFNGLYKVICQSHIPRYIIYDVAPFADYLAKKEDNSMFLAPLKRYYDCPGVSELFESIVNPLEGIKMQSYMYRYNSKFYRMLVTRFKSEQSYDNGYKGYLPKEEKMTREVEWTKDSEDKTFEHYFDPIRKRIFDEFIDECNKNGTKLIFCVSPWYRRTTDESFDYAKHIASKYGIPVINHYNDTILNTHSEYFYDAFHLNKKGAEVYTSIIANEIKQYIE